MVRRKTHQEYATYFIRSYTTFELNSGTIADYDKVIRIYSVWETKEKARIARGETVPTIRGWVISTDYPRAYHNRAIAKNLLGDKIGARKDFDKACSLGFKEDC